MMYPSAFRDRLEVRPPPPAEASGCPAVAEEDTLVAQAKANDPSALSAIYELYFDRIYRYVAVRLSDKDEAEDITQEVFIKVLGAIKNYHRRSVPFSSWLYSIAKHQVIDHVRHKSRHPASSLENAPVTSPFSGDNPEAAAEISYDMENLRLALIQLTPAQREVIILRFTSDLPMAKVARIMGKRVCTVKSLQHRAIMNLKKKLE